MARFAVVRKDLREGGLRVPAGEIHIGPKGHWNYRWLVGDVFQVYVEGAWLDADSADFDFSNEAL